MQRLPLLSSVLALSLAMSTPAAIAHVGHGDEFQAEGGINRVEVNTETDALMGIQVNPITAATDGSGAVMVPMSALVDNDGEPLVFVQYENFYEPVPVTTGETKGDRIAISEGLSVGEQLVTQGSLSLYAESRKTQTADAEPDAAPEEVVAAAPTAEEPATAAPDSETSEIAAVPPESSDTSGGLPVPIIAIVGVGAALVVGAVVVLGGKKGGA